MALRTCIVGCLLCVLSCGTLGYRRNFNKYNVRYGECLLEGLTCVELPQCPLIAREVYGTTRVSTLVVQLQKYLCGLNHGTVKVCCPEYSVIPHPHPRVFYSPPKLGIKGRKPTTNSIDAHRNFNLINVNCGVGLTDRIVGGQNALPGEFPWLAILQYNVSGVLMYLCGGSIITDLYVLTAAHCLAPTISSTTTKLVAVRLGEYDLNSEEDCAPDNSTDLCSAPPRDFAVAQMLLHSGYNQHDRVEFKDDIALIRLKTRVEFSEYVSPVCLPVPGRLTTQNGNLANFNLTAAGWGMTRTSTGSDIVMKVVVPYVEPVICEYNLRGRKLLPGQLCAGGLPAMNACNGDSGGPLIADVPSDDGSEDFFFQVGIVSVGFGSCLASTPSIFTDVEYFMPWILDNIRA